MWNSVNNTILNSILVIGEHDDSIDVMDADLEYTLVSGSRVQFHREKTGPRNAFCINKLLLYFSLFIHTKSG